MSVFFCAQKEVIAMMIRARRNRNPVLLYPHGYITCPLPEPPQPDNDQRPECEGCPYDKQFHAANGGENLLKEPKQKPKMGKPKALDKATRTAKDATYILKEGYKKQIRETQDRYGSGNNPADKPGRSVENLAEKGAGHVTNTTLKGGTYLVKNIRLNRKEEPVSQSGKGKQPHTPAGQRQLAAQTAKRKLQLKRGNDLKTKRQRVQKAAENSRIDNQIPSTPKTPEAIQKQASAQLTNAPKTPEAVQKQASARLTNTPKTPEAIQKQASAQLTNAPKTPEAVQKQASARPTNAPKTPEAVSKQAARSTPKNPQQTAAGHTAPMKQAVKQRQTAGKSAPKMKKKQADTIHQMKKQGVQKAKKMEAKTRKTVQKAATKQATKKARQAAQRETVKRSVQTIKTATKFIIRMVKMVIKAAAALVKALIAAAGPVAAIVVLVVIIGVVAALIASPFGVFFSDQDNTPDTTPIAEVSQELDQQFNVRIEEIIQAHSYVDSVEMHYTGTPDSVNHWYDMLAVFAVKTTMDKLDGMDVVTIDATRIDLIRTVFWDMNLIDYDVETIHHHDSSGDGDCWDEYILHIS